jgi:hypothetical protein
MAIDLIDRIAQTPVHQVQVADAGERLEVIGPKEAAPIRLPASFPLAIGAAAIPLVGLFWPPPATVQANPTEPLESVVVAAEDARSGLEDLAEAAKKEDNKELRDSVQLFTTKIDEMKQPGVDVKEALAKLSEMQASIAD